MIYKLLSMRDQKPNGISVMPLNPMPRSGIISVAMKFQKVSPRLTPSKQIMQNCAIIWLAWQENPDVSRAARMLSIVLSAYSFIVTIIANSKAVSSRLTLLISSTSSTHLFRHSPSSGLKKSFLF
jgi:hypothetical protein